MTHLYAPPAADLSMPVGKPGATYRPSPFRISGRIGRVRWLGYSTGYLICGIIFGSAAFTLAIPHFPLLESWFIATATFSVYGVFMLTGVRRLHDMNRSAWWTLITLIPVINFPFWLFLIFGKGADGPNEYGPAPGSNSKADIALAWLGAVLFAASMVVAVGIPAYEDYTKSQRATAATVR